MYDIILSLQQYYYATIAYNMQKLKYGLGIIMDSIFVALNLRKGLVSGGKITQNLQ